QDGQLTSFQFVRQDLVGLKIRGGRVCSQPPGLVGANALLTPVSEWLALSPNAWMTTRQAATMRASSTAYSTAVGPSSRLQKPIQGEVGRRNIFKGLGARPGEKRGPALQRAAWGPPCRRETSPCPDRGTCGWTECPCRANRQG